MSRKTGERIMIGDDVVITVLASRGGSVQIGVAAPKEIPVDREEVRIQKTAEGKYVSAARL